MIGLNFARFKLLFRLQRSWYFQARSVAVCRQTRIALFIAQSNGFTYYIYLFIKIVEKHGETGE